jgi:hypothetical protein
VRFDYVFDLEILGGGCFDILIDVALRIDDDSLSV